MTFGAVAGDKVFSSNSVSSILVCEEVLSGLHRALKSKQVNVIHCILRQFKILSL